MEESAYIMMARLFTFLSVFMLIQGLKFFFFGAKKKLQSASGTELPFIFRIFYNEIRILKDTFGSGMKHLFPNKSAENEKNIRLAALPLETGEVFGAQILLGLIFGICGIVFMILLEMDLSYIITAFVIGGFIGWLIPVPLS